MSKQHKLMWAEEGVFGAMQDTDGAPGARHGASEARSYSAVCEGEGAGRKGCSPQRDQQYQRQSEKHIFQAT